MKEMQNGPYSCPPLDLLAGETKSGISLRGMLEEIAPEASALTLALGRDDAGALVTLDLAKKGHVLIAGGADVEKRMCLYSVIHSLLFRASPRDVRLVLLDSQGSVFSAYRDIPHLLFPVIDYADWLRTDSMLRWAEQEMDCRYERIRCKGVRSIEEYNAALEENEEPMSRIVIVMAELSDLGRSGMEAAKEKIDRLSAFARIAGIHLVLATHRPDVNTLTGSILINIPNHIMLKVNRRIESLRIFGEGGAEKLKGCGDMLVKIKGEEPFEWEPLRRVQGYSDSDDAADADAQRVGDWLRERYPAACGEETAGQTKRIVPKKEEPDGSRPQDEKLIQAIELAIEYGAVSVCRLHRRLLVGYVRAERLVDEMTQRGIVGEADGPNKLRPVLISREEWQRMQENWK